MTDPLRPPETDVYPDEPAAARRTAAWIIVLAFGGLVLIALLAWWLR